MLRKLIFGLVLFFLFVLIQTPAGVWDQRLRAATQDSLALLNTQGSAWAGEAMLGVREPGSGRYGPVTRISWGFKPLRLLGGRFVWEFSLGARQPFPVELGISGIHTRGAALELPARFVLSRIPNAAGHAGWHGEMALSVPGLSCSWRGICDGDAQLVWQGAAADVFPGSELGDYVFDVQAKAGGLKFQLNTQRGAVGLKADGSLALDGALAVNGTVSGDPDFVGKLPNVAGRWVQRIEPGLYRFSFSQPGRGQ